MRSFGSRKKLLIGAGVLLFLFSLNLAPSHVRSLATEISSPLQASLWQAGNNIATFFAGGQLRREHEALRQEYSALLAQVVDLQDLKRENEELREMLNFGLAEEFHMVMADIIGKNIGEDVIVVRAGEEQGVRKGMSVITSGRIAVGKVVETFPFHARVRLISAADSKTDVRVAQAETTGVIRGQGGQELQLDLVPQTEDLQAGDILVTSNLGGVFPENLLVGEVKDVVAAGADPFQKAQVESFFSLTSAETVFVITSLQP